MSLGKGGRNSSGKLPRLPSGKSCRHTSESAPCCSGGPDPGSPCGSCNTGTTPSTIKLVTTGILQAFSRTINASGTWCLTQSLANTCEWKVRYSYACLTMSVGGIERSIVGVEAVVSIVLPGYWTITIQGVDQYGTAFQIRTATIAIPSGNCGTPVSGTFSGGGSFVMTPSAICTPTYDTCIGSKTYSDPCDCKPSVNPRIRLTFDVGILAGCQSWTDSWGTNWAWKVSDSTTYFTSSFELESGGFGHQENWTQLCDYGGSACTGAPAYASTYMLINVTWDCQKVEVRVIVHTDGLGDFLLFYGHAPVAEWMMESCSGVLLANNPSADPNHPMDGGGKKGPEINDPNYNGGGEVALAWVAS